jgi:hypothetical protein
MKGTGLVEQKQSSSSAQTFGADIIFCDAASRLVTAC